MKIAALADIHGNYQALTAVIDHVEMWEPDLVVVLGDIINRGPRSRECLHLIQDKQGSESWQVIQGNHEGYVLSFDDPQTPRAGPPFEPRRIIYWSYLSLSSEDIQAIKDLPVEFEIQSPGNKMVKAVHASLAGDRVGIFPDTSQKEMLSLIQPEASLFLVGHTHQPLIRKINQTTVVNAGSIGLPFDGDTRAGYAQITLQRNKWKTKIIRISYDLDAAVADFYSTGFIPDGGPLADLVLTELELAWPQIPRWFQLYEDSVLNQQISIEDAVKEFLDHPNIEK
jgi:putative phosphoesterase